MNDARKRKKTYQNQLTELTDKIVLENKNKFEFQELYNEVKKVIDELDLSNKLQIVKDIIDRVIFSERSGIEVWGHIPLAIQKLGYETERRNSLIGNRHFVSPLLVNSPSDPKMPFELIISLPKPRYERNIIARDSFGRIIHSKPPQSVV